jgi:hypothetical protein
LFDTVEILLDFVGVTVDLCIQQAFPVKSPKSPKMEAWWLCRHYRPNSPNLTNLLLSLGSLEAKVNVYVSRK